MIVAAMIPKMSPRWTVSPPSPGTAVAKSVRRGSQASRGKASVCWKPPSLHGPKTQNWTHDRAM